MAMLIVTKLGKTGATVQDKETGIQSFLPFYVIDEQYAVFEYRSPEGPQKDQTILIPTDELIDA